MKGTAMTTAAEAVEIALRGVSLTEAEANRLNVLIAARTRHPSAYERLSQAVLTLHVVGPNEIRMLQRLIREALAEQALQAVDAANNAQMGGSDAYETALAVKQAMLTDRPGA